MEDALTTDTLSLNSIRQRVREGRAALDARLAPLSEAQITTAHPPVGWNIKDVMAHIAFWEDYACQRLSEATRGEKPRLLGDIDEAEVDRINQEALEAGRARSLDAVQADFARTHRDLLAAIDAVPDDESDPWWGLWPDTVVPRRVIVYNTYDHYAEHLADIDRWLAG